MADKKEDKKKGVFTNYTKIPVKKRPYYYDYNDTSKEEKEFADMFSELGSFNDKLKDELKKDKPAKIKIKGSKDSE